MWRVFICFIFLVSVPTSCSLDRPLSKQPNGMGPEKGPHRLCTNCHANAEPKAGNAAFKQGSDPSSICLDCHDYRENHHPVGITPFDTARYSLPLYAGEIRCLTCHDIHEAPVRAGTGLLRGGPYTDRRVICFKCHLMEQYAAINPHVMLDKQGKVRAVNGKPVCLMCHAKQPDPAVDRTEDIRFKADIAYLCWRCHPPMPGIFFSQHFLAKPKPKTLEYMKKTEIEKLVILPLVPRGRVTCSTCHNPHQEGVIFNESAAKGAGKPAGLRLRPLCIACHLV